MTVPTFLGPVNVPEDHNTFLRRQQLLVPGGGQPHIHFVLRAM